jgi:hypothetical protein
MRKESKKIRYARETITIDGDTGEVKSQELITTTEVEKEPEFVKLYITDMMKLTGIPKSGSSILMMLLRYVNFNNQIVLIKAVKDQICKELDISSETLKKSLQMFIDKGILTREDRGVYVTNPFLFARGSWEHIRRIRLMIEYREGGRFFIKRELESVKSELPQLSKPKEESDKFPNGVEFSEDGVISSSPIESVPKND